MGKVLTKAVAEIRPAEDDGEAANGSFDVILSAPTLDRDGETLKPDEWKQPLPEHITFDADHAMTVAGTVGSGKPWLDDDGNLRVTGTYSSLRNAQDVRTLVNEGHIRSTSVAFMTEKSPQKDGRAKVTRELLNGAFVAIPANVDALVLSSKGLKAGRRNSAGDAERIQAIHDHAAALGASHDDGDENEPGKNAVRLVAAKAVAGSYEQRQSAICDALDAAYGAAGGMDEVWSYPLATFEGSVVYRVSGNTADAGQWQRSYTIDDAGQVTLADDAERVNMVEQVMPVKSIRGKAVGDPDDDVTKLLQGVDAALDEAGELLAGVDTSTLPEPVQQALGLVTTAEETLDQVLEGLGIPDPDDNPDEGSAAAADAAAKAAADAAAADRELRAAKYRVLSTISSS